VAQPHGTRLFRVLSDVLIKIFQFPEGILDNALGFWGGDADFMK
jgi:hypothetical protein